jgi:rubrerythrin
MPTKENLAAAFAGESQANRKYLAFAKKAEEEGLHQIAKLFRSVAEAETIHAHAHFRVMDGVKTTKENIVAAIAGELYEFTQMYPEFIKAAQQEGNKRAEMSFSHANAVEKVHHELYTQALNAVNAGKDLPGTEICVCPVCGDTFIGSAPDKCPVCKAPKEKFIVMK